MYFFIFTKFSSLVVKGMFNESSLGIGDLIFKNFENQESNFVSQRLRC